MRIRLNSVVKFLIYSDLIFYTGWGLISPIFALFLAQSLGLNMFLVGMASTINLVIRSLLRVPFGIRADKSQKTAYSYMLYGLFVAALVPVGYIFSKSVVHIYALQAVLGISLAMSTAGWTSIFSRHMDKGKESTEWGIDAVAVGLGPGIAGAVGGLAVNYFGFSIVFAIVAAIGVIGTLLLLIVKKEILKIEHKGEGKIFHERELRRIKKARVN